MNVLITGSNGFVGGWIARELRKNHYVIGSGTKEKSLIQVNRYIPWDISMEKAPDQFMDLKIDVIIHAAASLNKRDDSESLIRTNCLGTHRIYTLAIQKQVKKVIYLSSIPIIGIPNIVPIKENSNINPYTMYHATKAAGEYILNQLERIGIDIIHLRIPSPIGPGMPVKTVVPIFLNQALKDDNITLLGKGTRCQDYIDVRDIAFAIEKIMKKEIPCGIYNLASGKTVSNYELAKMCIAVLRSNSKIVFSKNTDPADSFIWDIDISKLRCAIGTFIQYSIEDSLKDISDAMNSKSHNN
ncbi:MAG: NAD(P)-dependent oxidoreductase [Lachnospiraceae bacterium]|nr:NAD(P)-dependent oxidoreductase [Lachnospiraceae bacterium]